MASARQRYSLGQQLLESLEVEQSPTTDIFAEEPVDLDTFIHDAKFMNQPTIRLGPDQYDLVRHLEQIYLPDTYPYMVQEFGEKWMPVRFVNLLYVQWGKGSGKDLALQFAFARAAYLLSCLNDPQGYFGKAGQAEIHLLNVAMNAAQAKRAFFKPLGNAIKRSPWFKDHLASEITPEATSIRLRKQIELISGHSLAANFEGLSTIMAVLDEISGFQSEEQKASRGVVESDRTAEAVYEIVRTSASTRFPRNYKVAAISYPRYLHDPIQNFCAKAEADIEKRGVENSRYYVNGPKATWEVNPMFFNEEFIKIPEADVPIPVVYQQDYEDDAVGARAKYECRPERAANRYLRNDSAIAQAFPHMEKKEGWTEPLQMYYYWGVDVEGARAEDSYELATTPSWQVGYQISPELVPMEGAIYALHVDLAVTSDRAGISMCHVKNWERREHMKGNDPNKVDADYQEDERPVVKVDFVSYYEADLQALNEDGEVRPREIQLRWARNLVRELRRRGFAIGRVTFDTYQSTDSIQMLELWGIEADYLSMDRNIVPYATFREVLYDGRIEGYYNEILQIELESLNLLPSGKIDHPPGGSKDMADALCGAVNGAVAMGGDEGTEPEEVDEEGSLDYSVHTNLGDNELYWGQMDLGFTQQDLQFNSPILR